MHKTQTCQDPNNAFTRRYNYISCVQAGRDDSLPSADRARTFGTRVPLQSAGEAQIDYENGSNKNIFPECNDHTDVSGMFAYEPMNPGTGWSKCNAYIDVYSEAARFECQLGHRLPSTEVCRGFLQSLQENAGILHQLAHDHFLSNSFQCIIHQSPYHWTLNLVSCNNPPRERVS